MSADEVQRNKRIVEEFVREVPIGGNLDAIDRLVAENYVQHNPNAGQGREGVREFFTNARQLLDHGFHAYPTLNVNLIGEGEFVVRQEVRASGMLIDIWRVSDGQLQEHWDAFRAAQGFEQLGGF